MAESSRATARWTSTAEVVSMTLAPTLYSNALEQPVDGGFSGDVVCFEHLNRVLQLVRQGDQATVARFRRHPHMEYAVRARHRDLVRQCPR